MADFIEATFNVIQNILLSFRDMIISFMMIIPDWVKLTISTILILLSLLVLYLLWDRRDEISAYL